MLHLLDSLSPEEEAKLLPNDPVAWIEDQFRIPETPDHRLHLEEYQKACLREVLTQDSEGNFPYSIVIWSDIKKSIKSTIAAAVALWRAYNLQWGHIYIVANDLKQADSRVGYYMRRAIELNPRMRKTVKLHNYSIVLPKPNRTRIESVPIDPSGEAGGDADMVVFSELWGAHEQAKQRMWAEMTLPPAKFRKSFRWVETYAGYSGESPLLEGLYETGVKLGEPMEMGKQFDPPLQVARSANSRMFCLWNDTARMPWQTNDYYASEAATLLPNEFRRIHKNEWVSSLSTFVPGEWVDGCSVDPAPKWDPKNDPMVFALDAAISGDTFGLLGVSKTKEGTHVRYVNKWKAPMGGKIDYKGPKEEVQRLAKEHNVLCFTYDPYQLHSLMTELGQELRVWMREFSQAGERAIADKELYDAIRDRKATHNGEPDLIEHVKNANAKTEGENKLRIIKRSDHLKIDLAVCWSMAHHTAMMLNL